MAKKEDKKFSITGVLKDVTSKEGTGQHGDWKKTSLTIVKKDGTKRYVGTFDEDMHDLAKKYNKKEIKAVFVKNGKYNNLVDDGLTLIGAGETQVQEEVEEEVSDDEAEEEVDVESSEEVEEVSGSEKDNYWEKKFKFDVKTYEERQTQIRRQNSQTQAQKYIENMLKAVELGILTKKDVPAEDLILKEVIKAAHSFEKDVMRED